MVTLTKKKQKQTKTPQKSDSELMRISEASRNSCVNKQTIEYYVMLGLIDPIRPDGGRGRFFDDSLIKRIKLIYKLNQSGYTLREIRETYLADR